MNYAVTHLGNLLSYHSLLADAQQSLAVQMATNSWDEADMDIEYLTQAEISTLPKEEPMP